MANLGGKSGKFSSGRFGSTGVARLGGSSGTVSPTGNSTGGQPIGLLLVLTRSS